LRSPSRRAPRALVAAAFALAAVALAGPAAAADDDGAYGRFDGDLELGAGAGVGLAPGGPALIASATAVYLGTAGVYAHYADALGALTPRTARSVAAGVVLRPLFLGRNANDFEQGPARLDLLVDSFAFEVGAAFRQPTGDAFQATPGLELAVEAALPLLPEASGPHLALRAALRLEPDTLAHRAQGNVVETGGLVSLVFAWRSIVATHLVDARDDLPR
jgi:hypothetical protein